MDGGSSVLSLSMVYASDITCYNQIRMNRATFDRLCGMLDNIGGLWHTRNMLVDEQVTIFLHILAHHVKNRVIQFRFGRLGERISRYFHYVLQAMIRLVPHLFKKPEPVADDSTDERWKWFKGCLGALDWTHIRIRVPVEDQPRYRNRKGEITTNVLGVCSRDRQFVYVLSGWEGSAAVSQVLQSAILKPNGLKVPEGQHYLVDAGFTNGPGFLASYRGQQYHFSEWREARYPTNPKECFNMRHSSARNHNRIIIACCLLHNLIRQDNALDPLENEVDEDTKMADGEPIGIVETSNAWTAFHDRLAADMFNENHHRGRRNRIKLHSLDSKQAFSVDPPSECVLGGECDGTVRERRV
ncbi:protein ALP1-like [Senna tora]|uniref:Protein ALP1-like n=1 Tax=Senna tora TaxID=362788 RepID=A0A834T4Q2_9FABA|nr:protein ALP1-like [Senna tora]